MAFSADGPLGSFQTGLHRIKESLVGFDLMGVLFNDAIESNESESQLISFFSTETFSFSADIPKQCSDRIDRRILAQV